MKQFCAFLNLLSKFRLGVLVLFLLLHTSAFAQNLVQAEITAQHKNLKFIESTNTQIDSLQAVLSSFFYTYDNSKNDSLHLANLHAFIFSKLNDFSAFNHHHLQEIDKKSNLNKSLSGNDILYLNQSFNIYLRYDSLYAFMIKKFDQILKVRNEHFIRYFKLEAMLQRLYFFELNYDKFIRNKKIRRIFNLKDAAFTSKKNRLKHLSKMLFGRKNYNMIRKEIMLVDSEFSFLSDVHLYESISEQEYNKTSFKRDFRQFRCLYTKDAVFNSTRFVTQNLSAVFGNFIGLFHFRKGYLYGKDTVVSYVMTRLKPMSILLEKTEFCLTDKFIPGYFGHAAIWLGTASELKQLGIWDADFIKPYQKQILAEKNILETNRSGTHLTSLKDFMNVDAVAVVLYKDFEKMTAALQKQMYRNAFNQLGKSYDFNFDVENSQKLFCSELIYLVFGQVNWHVQEKYNRFTIVPDDIIWTFNQKDVPLYLTLFIRRNKDNQISDKRQELLQKLIEKTNE